MAEPPPPWPERKAGRDGPPLRPCRSVNCQRARPFSTPQEILAMNGRIVSNQRGVIFGHESLVVNSEFSISTARRSVSNPQAFLTEFKPTEVGRPTSRFRTGIQPIQAQSIHFGDGIQWLQLLNPLGPGLGHNASRVETNGFSAESLDSKFKSIGSRFEKDDSRSGQNVPACRTITPPVQMKQSFADDQYRSARLNDAAAASAATVRTWFQKVQLTR